MNLELVCLRRIIIEGVLKNVEKGLQRQVSGQIEKDKVELPVSDCASLCPRRAIAEKNGDKPQPLRIQKVAKQRRFSWLSGPPDIQIIDLRGLRIM